MSSSGWENVCLERGRPLLPSCPLVGRCGEPAATMRLAKDKALLIGHTGPRSTVPESPTIPATFPSRHVGHFPAQLLHMSNIVVPHKRVEHFPPTFALAVVRVLHLEPLRSNWIV